MTPPCAYTAVALTVTAITLAVLTLAACTATTSALDYLAGE